MDQLNVGDLVFAVVQLFKNLNEPVTDEGVSGTSIGWHKGHPSVASKVALSRPH
jgi:hypothetical protein